MHTQCIPKQINSASTKHGKAHVGNKCQIYKTDLLLFVAVAPSFTIEPNNKTVMEIDIVIFYCSATGNPTPKITWIKDGKTVDTGDTLSVIADRNQSGEYWCSADNGLSEAINTSAYLDVQCKYYSATPYLRSQFCNSHIFLYHIYIFYFYSYFCFVSFLTHL